MKYSIRLFAYSYFFISSAVMAATVQPTRVETNLGPGCHVAATVPITGIFSGIGGDAKTGMGGLSVNPLPKEWHSQMDAIGFSLRCEDVSNLQGSSLAVYDANSKTWKKDLDARFGQLIPLTPEDRQLLDAATQVLNISSVNASGYVELEDDTTGDEDKRQRNAFFCLFHEGKSLCGAGVVSYLNYPNSDITEHAIEILRTIEFLPDVPATEPVKP